MLVVTLVLLIGIPILEIYVAVQVAHLIGGGLTLVLLVLLSFLGWQLLRRQGARTWREVRLAVNEGRSPGREASNGALILVGAALLTLPGFVTAAVGLLFLFPPIRALIRRTGWLVLLRRFPWGSGAVVVVDQTGSVRVEPGAPTLHPPHGGPPPSRPTSPYGGEVIDGSVVKGREDAGSE
jgi:UPF0716 protein FxsA